MNGIVEDTNSMETLLWGVISCLNFLPISMPIESIPLALDVVEYQKGQSIKHNVLSTPKEFFDYFKKNNKGWHTSCATYAPSYILWSDDMSINILENNIVINYRDQKNNNYHQTP